MQITKYVHSCLLIENEGKTMLFDPGNYSAESGVLEVNSLPELDAVLITHGHFDHCNIPFIKQTRERFPEVPIVSNQEVVSTLDSEGITATTEPVGGVTYEQATHQLLPWRTPAPDNWSITVFDQLTHPGDSLQISKTAPILALPVQAPWGSMRESLDMVLELQPEVVIPIHDWHWRDEARVALYEKAQRFLQEYGIELLSVESGQPVEV